MPTEVAYDYAEEQKRVIAALRPEFPHDTISTEPGYKGRVHLKIVSERFNGMPDRQKNETVRELLREKLGAGEQVVSILVVYGTDEL